MSNSAYTVAGTSGVPQVWVNYSTAGAAASILASFNVTSLTYVSTGLVTVNMTVPFSTANYSTSGSCGAGGTAALTNHVSAPFNTNPTASTIRAQTLDSTNSATEGQFVSLICTGFQ